MELLSLAIIGVIIVTLVLGTMKRFDLTLLLVAGNLVVFLISLLMRPAALFSDLAFQPIDLQNGTAAYTVITSMFIHSGVLHILGNIIFLILLGLPLEARIGKRRFAAVYFVAGIGGALMAAAVLWNTPYVYMVGASGAISGVVGAFLVLYPRDEIMMPLGFIILPKVPVWAGALSWLFFDVFLVVINRNSDVSWEAHIGGFMAGLLVGLLIGRHVEEERRREEAPLDLSRLEAMATTPQLRNALENARKENHPDVRRAWLEYFAEHATCPKCGGKMKFRKDRLICVCGEEVEIR